MYIIILKPPILKAIIDNGINETITPATGIRPRTNIMNPSPNICGKSSIYNIIIDRIQLIKDMVICVCITFPNESKNLRPKKDSSSYTTVILLFLKPEVNRTILFFSRIKNKLKITAINILIPHLPILVIDTNKVSTF
jgi:hypothetical protein